MVNGGKFESEALLLGPPVYGQETYTLVLPSSFFVDKSKTILGIFWNKKGYPSTLQCILSNQGFLKEKQ